MSSRGDRVHMKEKEYLRNDASSTVVSGCEVRMK